MSVEIVVSAGKKDDLQEKATLLEVGKDCLKMARKALSKAYKKQE